MSDRSDVVDRADALMRGRRSFVTKTVRPDPAPPAIDDDDDLPVLTEVVAPSGESATAPPVPAAPPEVTYSEADLAALGAEMAQAVAQQLHFELPTLIEAAMANAGEELRAGIASTIDDAVRDFIAQHRRLPNGADKTPG